MDDEERHFANEFVDVDESTLPYNASTKEVRREWSDKLWSNIRSLLQILDKRLQTEIDWKDNSVYTGTCGIALLYYHLALLDQSHELDHLSKALSYVEPSLSAIKGHKVTFLCGDPGPLAIAAVIYHKLRMLDKSHELLKKLLALKKEVCSKGHVPDELLYGRAGYLYALLFVRHHIGSTAIEATVIKAVVAAILNSGTQLAKHENWKSPLMFKWHDKHYLGAAHGIAGILYVLMSASEFVAEKELETYVKPTVDFVVSCRLPSGNYPSSLGNKSDRLVHWCHGAPGLVHAFLKAHQLFGCDAYLHEAVACGDVLWHRGLLRKGDGLCHGTAGNAYAFLALFRTTNDVRHLHRACKFAEWCFDYGKHGCRTPDRPLSLFEGLAGTIYFLVSMLNPWDAAFPAFHLGP